MKQGFVKVAAVTPKIVVADTKENTALICAEIKKAEKEGAKIIVLPELCITGLWDFHSNTTESFIMWLPL